MAKKTPESKEAAAERRQRELAALTSGVAAFSLMGGPPRAEAPAAPAKAPAATTPAAEVPTATVAVATPQPTNSKPKGKPLTQPAAAAPTPAAEPVSVPVAAPVTAGRGGEEPAAVTKARVTPAAAPEFEEDELEDEEELEPELEEVAGAEPELPAARAELDLGQLFVPSAEKKGTTLRITADHQQFFTNLGFLLGNGASAPDIIHNILNNFRTEHEALIQKAMKKKMRQMMSPKK